jgi:hypothetical protein
MIVHTSSIGTIEEHTVVDGLLGVSNTLKLQRGWLQKQKDSY